MSKSKSLTLARKAARRIVAREAQLQSAFAENDLEKIEASFDAIAASMRAYREVCEGLRAS